MKVKLELFGASRDLSDKDFLEFNIKEKSSIKDLRKEIINYVDDKFLSDSERAFYTELMVIQEDATESPSIK